MIFNSAKTFRFIIIGVGYKKDLFLPKLSKKSDLDKDGEVCPSVVIWQMVP